MPTPPHTPRQLLNAEFHAHTHYSKDCLLSPARLIEVCRRRGIDRVAITDHNSLGGAQEGATLAPDMVIMGEEIMTTQGELMGYFVSEMIPPGLTPEATIERLRAQGAFISVSHPFDPSRPGSWSDKDLRRILPLVDALEVYNSRTWWQAPNERAAALAAEAGLLRTAGSDAHHAVEVGRTLMRLPHFDDAGSLRRALTAAEILARPSSPAVHLFSRYATLRKMVGWRIPRREPGTSG